MSVYEKLIVRFKQFCAIPLKWCHIAISSIRISVVVFTGFDFVFFLRPLYIIHNFIAFEHFCSFFFFNLHDKRTIRNAHDLWEPSR